MPGPTCPSGTRSLRRRGIHRPCGLGLGTARFAANPSVIGPPGNRDAPEPSHVRLHSRQGRVPRAPVLRGQGGPEAAAGIAGGVAYQFGDHTACFLYDAGEAAGTSRASQAFWKVDDLEREVSQLRGRGVEFEHYEPDEIGGMTMQGDIAEGGSAKAAWFRDSEGNIMALIEDRN